MVSSRGLAVREPSASRSVEPETRRSIEGLSPADKVTIAYLAIIAILTVISMQRASYWPEIAVAHVLAVAAIVILALLAKRLSPGASSRPELDPSRSLLVVRFVHGWYPIALIPLTYKELTYLVPRIHPRDFDVQLAALDYRLFGVHATVWIEKFTWPPLTDLLQLTYATYYFLPIVLGAVLWGKRWADRYNFWVFVVALGFFLSYLGYIMVPAIGPRFLPSIVDAQSGPLRGIYLFAPIRHLLDQAEGITRDCFPSGHVEITLLVLYYAARFHRRTFWCLLPFGAGVIVSTVYLRYHYLVDVAAGVVLALIVIFAARNAYRWLGGWLPQYPVHD
jgi:membrane-associated phospholipid phosphatase